jgi:vancomycin resistance protein YoaR
MPIAVRVIISITLLVGLAAAIWLPGREGVLGSYATSLHGRTRGQHMNALRAARALDGTLIEPGAVFSFNRTVGSWTPDRGYVLAPVSYDGELVVDWGGGVCQTSSTLYNAALLAGLEIIERHRHTWAPKYIPPGQDAAVAQRTIDLRLRNPYPWPVRLAVTTGDERIGIRILGRAAGPMVHVAGQAHVALTPIEIFRRDDRLPHGQRRILTHGRPGLSVTVYRTYPTGKRELVSQDTYPAMNTVIAVGP